jgi:hypothetical protein
MCIDILNFLFLKTQNIGQLSRIMLRLHLGTQLHSLKIQLFFMKKYFLYIFLDRFDVLILKIIF